MSLSDENSNAEGGNGFLSSTPSPLGEETKGGGSDGNGSLSFSFKTPKGLNIEMQSLEDIFAAVPEEREWTVDGILPKCGLAVVGGRHKRGKSTLVIHLAKSVEAGEVFLDRETKKGAVVYVNYEMALDYFASLSKGESVHRNFYVIDHPESRLTMDTVAAVIGELKKRGFETGMLIIDSFRGAFKLRAEQENQSGEAGMILRSLQEIGVKTGWLILVIHHHKKNTDAEGADKLSGTSDFGAAPDVIWTWSRPADHLKPGLLEIEGRMPPVEPLQVQLSPEKCVSLGAKQDGSEENEKQRILDALAKGKPLTGKEISDATIIPYSTVKKRLNSLKDEGRATFDIGTGKGSPQLWYSVTCQ